MFAGRCGGGALGANRKANIPYGIRAALAGAPLQAVAGEARGKEDPKETDRRFEYGENNSVSNRRRGPAGSQGLRPNNADVSKVGALLSVAIRLLDAMRTPCRRRLA